MGAGARLEHRGKCETMHGAGSGPPLPSAHGGVAAFHPWSIFCQRDCAADWAAAYTGAVSQRNDLLSMMILPFTITVSTSLLPMPKIAWPATFSLSSGVGES